MYKELLDILDLYRGSFSGRRNYINGKNIKIGGRNYTLNLYYGCFQEGCKLICFRENGKTYNCLDIRFEPHKTIIKCIKTAYLECGPSTGSLKMLNEDHIMKYMDWTKEMMKEYIDHLKLFIVELI